jgi:hypothetical protein
MVDSLPPAELRALLEREREGRLLPEEAARLGRAVGDPDLARDHQGWQTVRAALRPTAEEAYVRPGLAEEILAAVRREPAPVVVGPWRRFASAAAALVLGVGLFGLGRASVDEPQEVVAHPREIEREEARRREELRRFGCDPAMIENDLEIGRLADRRRAALRAALRPELEAIDREEIREKWANLSPEARRRWLEHDPGLKPPEEAGGARGDGK